MAITDPQAIRFINESIRPMAEKLRALKAEADALLASWNNGQSALIAVDGGDVEDGRALEGVTRITGNDVVGVVIQVQAFQTQLNQPGVGGVIAKPCVRPLTVS